MASRITSSSTAEYFAKNLQQVGFSSPLKAVLTTLKEAVDNSLDACEEAGILPELFISIDRVGKGSGKSTDLVEIIVEDNGPGLDPDDLGKVFGEYLASSKFGRGQCTRGQQGIGISAATTWAQLTNASGVKVITKTKNMRKAVKAQIDVDIKANRGIVKNKETIDWDKSHGVRVEFRIDGRIQLNGEGGLLTYIEGTTLVNPHLHLEYKLLDQEKVKIERVSKDVPEMPKATLPHPHTMKLGEFITHSHLYNNLPLDKFLTKGFTRVFDQNIKDFVKNGLPKAALKKTIKAFKEAEFKTIFSAIQGTELQNPSTRSVLTIGEESMSKSIQRLGQVDFFSVVGRKPVICDFKPVVVEVAIARFLNKASATPGEEEQSQLLRFANRVPLQFDKSACAITHAVESVNWKAYGLNQAKNSIPLGPYVIAVSVTSPFIKFKNASKETIDATDELVEEIRLALMRAGQKLSRHIKREFKEADLERKLQHIEKFAPILVEGLARITGASKERKKKAEEGLKKILGRDEKTAKQELETAKERLSELKARDKAYTPEDGEDGAASLNDGDGRPGEGLAGEGSTGAEDSASAELSGDDSSGEAGSETSKGKKGKGKKSKGNEKSKSKAKDKSAAKSIAVAESKTVEKAKGGRKGKSKIDVEEVAGDAVPEASNDADSSDSKNPDIGESVSKSRGKSKANGKTEAKSKMKTKVKGSDPAKSKPKSKTKTTQKQAAKRESEVNS